MEIHTETTRRERGFGPGRSEIPVHVVPMHEKNAHMIVTCDEGHNWLVDTGNPWTFGKTESVSLDGTRPGTRPHPWDEHLDEISKHIGCPLHGVLGNDVLSNFDWEFDQPTGLARFGRRLPLLEGLTLALRKTSALAVPAMQVQVGGRCLSAWIDTGARYSYLHHPLRCTFPFVERVRDFMPGQGDWNTDLRKVRFSLPTKRGDWVPFYADCGQLPRRLSLYSVLSKVILGSDLFHARKTGYYPRRLALVLA